MSMRWKRESARESSSLLTSNDCGLSRAALSAVPTASAMAWLARETFVVDAADGGEHEGDVGTDYHGALGQEVGERHERTGLLLHVGNNADLLLLLARQLALHFKGADGIYVVAEEVDAVGVFGGEGEYVQQTTAQGIFARLVNVIYAAESQFFETVSQFREVVARTATKGQRAGLHLLLRGNALCQSIGMAHHEKALRIPGLLPARQSSQYVRAQYFIGCIALGILHRTAIGGRIKQDILIAEYLHHIMVEIACPLFIVEQYQEGGSPLQLAGQSRQE